jgi:hypothetical protein
MHATLTPRSRSNLHFTDSAIALVPITVTATFTSLNQYAHTSFVWIFLLLVMYVQVRGASVVFKKNANCQ